MKTLISTTKHNHIFEGLFILRLSSDYFLTGLSSGSAKRAGPVLSPDSHPSPVNSPALLCWHQHSCSNGVTRLRELIQIKISRGKKLSAALIPSFSRSEAALAAGWCWRQGWERAARRQSRTSPLGSHFQVDWIKRVVKVSSESHLQERFVCWWVLVSLKLAAARGWDRGQDEHWCATSARRRLPVPGAAVPEETLPAPHAALPAPGTLRRAARTAGGKHWGGRGHTSPLWLLAASLPSWCPWQRRDAPTRVSRAMA